MAFDDECQCRACQRWADVSVSDRLNRAAEDVRDRRVAEALLRAINRGGALRIDLRKALGIG